MALPFDFKRGIRQGCSLSGYLYSISIEPLLSLIRRNNRITGLPISIDKLEVRVSAYADDINLFITYECFQVISELLSLHKRSSNASINVLKSNGLWCGSWKYRQDRSLEICCNNKGLQFLGKRTFFREE